MSNHHSTAPWVLCFELPFSALKPLLLGAVLGLASSVHALPTNGVVTVGNATITNSGANSLTINQTSPSAVLNWQSFNIGTQDSVVFVQPGPNAVALNRVIGADPSGIFGSLTSNGRVFLVNPNGILFGKDASVNVGSLVASALDISNENFIAGRYRFDGASNGEVRNQGTLRAGDGGYVALLGNRVTNDGSVVANLGTVSLAAGNAITLDMAGDGLVNVTVDKAAFNALASNGGLLQADGGAILMSAAGKDALLGTVVNNTGIVQANTVSNRNGRIVLDGGDSGVVNVGGELRAIGQAAGTKGGTIVTTGDKILVAEHAQLDVSGDSGGGAIYVGGGWQGTDPSMRQASGVYVSGSATLDASAKKTGNGGTVVAWSDIHNPLSTTRVYGTLLARGGVEGGDGGRIETSGRWLDVAGITANASAPRGKSGQWLLDPGDLTVTAVPTTATFTPGPFGTFTSGSGSNVMNTDIEAQLNGGTGVVLLGDNIFISANIAKTAGGGTVLIFNAPGTIALSPGTTISSSSGGLDVIFDSGSSISLGSGSSISSNGGDIVLSTLSFSNNAGSGALNTSGGGPAARWIVYSNDPSGNGFGGLSSGNPAIWGQTTGSLAPGAVASGNRYVFATPGAITVTTTSPAPKPYGQVISVANNLTYSGAPLTGAASYGNVYQDLLLSDVLSVLPTASSAGSGATATVAGGPYPVIASGGVANTGFSINYVITGLLVINRAVLGVSAIADAKTYDGVAYTGGHGVTYTGFLDGDTAAALGGSLLFTGNSQGAVNAGQYLIVPSGYTSDNYAIQYFGAPLIINRKPVTVTGLLADSKEFDGNNVAKIRDWGTAATGVGLETLVLNHGDASFSDPDVGKAKTVTAVGYSLANGSSGGLASNYVLTASTTTTTADIVVAGRAQSVQTVQAAFNGLTGSGAQDRWRDNFDRDANQPDVLPTFTSDTVRRERRESSSGVGALATATNGALGNSAVGGQGGLNREGAANPSTASQNAASQSTSRFKTAGLSSKPSMGKPATTSAKPAVPEKVFLKGTNTATTVGVTTTGAVLVATVSGSGRAQSMTLTVAAGDGFEMMIPEGFLGKNAGRLNAPPVLAQSASGGPIPPWITYRQSDKRLSSRNVPATGLPLTIRFVDASGKLAEVTLK